MTQSNLNLMKNAIEGTASFDEMRSFTALEVKYLVSVLKNRSVQANQIKEKQFDTIYMKARMTLKI